MKLTRLTNPDVPFGCRPVRGPTYQIAPVVLFTAKTGEDESPPWTGSSNAAPKVGDSVLIKAAGDQRVLWKKYTQRVQLIISPGGSRLWMIDEL